MTYCIVNVIYGVPLNKEAYDEFENLGIDTEEVCTLLYSGGAEVEPGFCGVELDEFDEATDMALQVSKLKMTPTPAQIKNAHAKIAKLPPTVRALLQPTDVYFIFSTS